MCTYEVDVVRELSPLIVVNRMRNVSIGSLHSGLSRLGGKGDRGCLLLQLHVELEICHGCEAPVLRRRNLLAHLDPVLQLDLTTSIYCDVLEGLPRTVVRLSCGLQNVQDVRLVDSTRCICGNRAAATVSGNKAVQFAIVTYLNLVMRSNISS